MTDEEDPSPKGWRDELRRIRSEIGGVSFFLFLALIVTCQSCDNLDDIDQDLEKVHDALQQTNTEIRETRRVLERVLEQQRAR
ncbi:MAG: hypothetical protein Q7R80_00490 [bacterium]|nr:hypothetical protein [bacterium]